MPGSALSLTPSPPAHHPHKARVAPYTAHAFCDWSRTRSPRSAARAATRTASIRETSLAGDPIPRTSRSIGMAKFYMVAKVCSSRNIKDFWIGLFVEVQTSWTYHRNISCAVSRAPTAAIRASTTNTNNGHLDPPTARHNRQRALAAFMRDYQIRGAVNLRVFR